MGKLLSVPLDSIRPNPVALRSVNRQADTFKELVDSVRKQGIINAISLREKPGDDGKQYELIDGLHRFTSAQEVGLKEIPAQIVDRTDAEALATQLMANVHKVETRPVEYAKALLRILSGNATLTEAQLASQLAKSPAWIADQLGLVKLDEQIQKLVNDGKITLSNAYPLTKLPKEEQLNWLDRAMTMSTGEFGPKVLARVKEIRDAARKGKDAAPEQFVPVAHLRKKTELEAEAKDPKTLSALIKSQKAKDPLQAAQLAVLWVLNLDPESQQAQKDKHEANQKAMEEAKARRKAERDAKRAAEAKAKDAGNVATADQARAAAESANTAAAQPA